MTLGGAGTSKTYNDRESGIIVQVTSGIVINQFGRPMNILAQGTPIRDFARSRIRTATIDRLLVHAPTRFPGEKAIGNQSFADEISVYHSQVSCYMSQASDGTISCSCQGSDG